MSISGTLDTINVMIVDDHELVRQGIKKVASRDASIKIVGEAADRDDAISLISQLQPDVALLDIRLREGSGIDVSRAVKDIAPNTRVLVLSAYDDDQYVRSAIRFGASGYLVKTASAKELTRAIHDVAEGRLAFSPEVCDKVKELLRETGDTKDRENVPVKSESVGRLTMREGEILRYLKNGLSNREIAEILGIAVKTVEAHIEHVLVKLGARNRTQAVLFALRDGMLLETPQ